MNHTKCLKLIVVTSLLLILSLVLKMTLNMTTGYNKNSILLDQVYHYKVDDEGNAYIELHKDGQYFIYFGKNIYASDEKLKEKRSFEEIGGIYPELILTQGKFDKQHNEILLKPQYSTIIRFYDISALHKKRYFEKETKKLVPSAGGKIIFSWRGLYYQTKGINKKVHKIKLKKSSKPIPSSEEDFLEQYTYVPDMGN